MFRQQNDIDCNNSPPLQTYRWVKYGILYLVEHTR